MGGFSDFDNLIYEMMQDFGGAAEYVVTSKGTRDPSTGDVPITKTAYPVEAIMMDLTLQSNGTQVIDGTLIQAGDKRCYVRPRTKSSPQEQALPTIQPNKDKFKMAGVTYQIVTIKEINPTATDNILTELYLRR